MEHRIMGLETDGLPMVSVIMPTYNSELYVGEAIESVISQSLQSWELIIVDDCSQDDTCCIVNRYATADGRIRFYKQQSNSGPAVARNLALGVASGRYIAYLDSDDVWMPDKLKRQIAFMRTHDIGMCFTSYETINQDGSHRNYVHVPDRIDYKGFLKRPVTCTHTIAFDTRIVDKDYLIMPDLKKRQDGATWLRVLKAGYAGYGYDEVLAKNRKRSGSVSSNKISAMKYTWHLYHDVEGLSVPYAAYCQFWQLFHACTKRIGRMK